MKIRECNFPQKILNTLVNVLGEQKLYPKNRWSIEEEPSVGYRIRMLIGYGEEPLKKEEALNLDVNLFNQDCIERLLLKIEGFGRKSLNIIGAAFEERAIIEKSTKTAELVNLISILSKSNDGIVVEISKRMKEIIYCDDKTKHTERTQND